MRQPYPFPEGTVSVRLHKKKRMVLVADRRDFEEALMVEMEALRTENMKLKALLRQLREELRLTQEELMRDQDEADRLREELDRSRMLHQMREDTLLAALRKIDQYGNRMSPESKIARATIAEVEEKSTKYNQRT